MDKYFRPIWPPDYPEFLLKLFKAIEEHSLLTGIGLDGQFFVDYDAFKEWFEKAYATKLFNLEWERNRGKL